MSKPRYDWWPYAKGMIRRYPELKQEYEELHMQSITASYSGMASAGGGNGRALETLAIRELPTTKQREYEAVSAAIKKTQRLASGKDRLRLVDLVFWQRCYNLDGACYRLHIAPVTGRRWHGDFIREVGKAYGLMDE